MRKAEHDTGYVVFERKGTGAHYVNVGWGHARPPGVGFRYYAKSVVSWTTLRVLWFGPLSAVIMTDRRKLKG